MKDQHDVELIVRTSHSNNMGILIELPGVILATFIPILENFQRMQRLSQFPLRQWIVANGDGNQNDDSTATVSLLRYMPGIATSIFLLSRY
jgi:hypothetical protein